MSHGPLPTVLAWLVADHVYRDQSSKRCYILGTYSALGSLAFPFTHPGLHAYAALTELHRLEENLGAVDIELTPVDLREIDSAASKIAVQGARYSEQQERLTGR
jgi:hypothetical protein